MTAPPLTDELHRSLDAAAAAVDVGTLLARVHADLYLPAPATVRSPARRRPMVVLAAAVAVAVLAAAVLLVDRRHPTSSLRVGGTTTTADGTPTTADGTPTTTVVARRRPRMVSREQYLDPSEHVRIGRGGSGFADDPVPIAVPDSLIDEVSRLTGVRAAVHDTARRRYQEDTASLVVLDLADGLEVQLLQEDLHGNDIQVVDTTRELNAARVRSDGSTYLPFAPNGIYVRALFLSVGGVLTTVTVTRPIPRRDPKLAPRSQRLDAAPPWLEALTTTVGTAESLDRLPG